MIKHKHHIIPKHAGGTDDPSNLIELTVEEHADAHRILYEEHGRWQDYVAWKTLSGAITNQEATLLAQKNADRSWMYTEEGKEILRKANEKKMGKTPWNKGLTKETNEIVRQYSDSVKKTMKSGNIKTIGDIMRGKEFSEEHRRKLSEVKRNESRKTCEHCNKTTSRAMYARWHGPKCRENGKKV